MITADTNVFVYAADDAEPRKQAIAQHVVRRLMILDSPMPRQIVGELQNALRRKLKLGSWRAAMEARQVLTTFRTFPASVEATSLALAQLATERLSYWDALMLAASQEVGCTAMLTEDLQDGATLFGIQIVNPFGATGLSSRAAELLGLS